MKKNTKKKIISENLLIKNINKESFKRPVKQSKNNIIKYKYNNFKSKAFYFLAIIIIIQFILNMIYITKTKVKVKEKVITKQNSDDINNSNFITGNFEEFEVDIFNSIKDKIQSVIEMNLEEQQFLNGVIRKYKPKKLFEIGVSAGGSSIVMLNAIKDIPDTKLFSIDKRNEYYRKPSKKAGWAVKEKFPELANKWTLYTGINTAEVIEKIGNNIDLVLIDTVHSVPGEMFNWLEVLPFLKEEAIVVFHDVFAMFVPQFIHQPKKTFSNNQLLCYIRGTLILPSYGNKFFSRNIGAIKLEVNQEKYYKIYFMGLGNQWEYFPDEKDLDILREHYKKYYGEKLVEIYNDAIEKNKIRFHKKI